MLTADVTVTSISKNHGIRVHTSGDDGAKHNAELVAVGSSTAGSIAAMCMGHSTWT
jgi:hypothetical protein